jgi:predicted phage tail protein
MNVDRPEKKPKRKDTKVVKWARTSLGVGLIVLLAGLVVGKLTTGGVEAQILGIAGAALMAGAGLAALLSTVISKVRGDQPLTDS